MLYHRAQIDAAVQREYNVPTLIEWKKQQEEKASARYAIMEQERRAAAENDKRL